LSLADVGAIAKNKVMLCMPLSNAEEPIIRGFELAYAFYPPQRGVSHSNKPSKEVSPNRTHRG
jgi:hypothetical protein